jgi:multidrug efflux pump subunit AcrA (membrane-fusion protein)
LSDADSIFREEALIADRQPGFEGKVLRTASRWLRGVYLLVLMMVVTAAAYLTVATAHDYATAPAILRLERAAPAPLGAPAAGAVQAVLVRPGERVAPGRPLIRLTLADSGRAAAAPTRRGLAAPGRRGEPFDCRQLAPLMVRCRSGGPPGPELLVRAPAPAVVAEIAVTAGQPVDRGAPLLTLQALPTASVVAVFRPTDSPLLHTGTVLRWRPALAGQPTRALLLERQGAALADAGQARAALGIDHPEAQALRGPVLIVRARFDAPEEAGGALVIPDRTEGVVEVRGPPRRLMVWLFPGLQTILGSPRG